MKDFHLNPKDCALLVVDVQVDFCSPDGATAKRGRPNTKMQAIPDKINTLVKEIDGSGILPIYIRAIVDEDNLPSNMRFFNEMKGVKRPTQKNTEGAEFYGLDFPDNPIFFEKSASDPFTRTNFTQLLTDNGITTVLVCGVRTEICVEATARRAFNEGFTVIVLSDLVATRDNNADDETHSLKFLDAYVGFVMDTTELKRRLQ